MDNNMLKVTQEELNELSIEELVDLKIETESLLGDIDELIENCDDILNS